MSNLYISTYLGAYRVDLCEFLHRELGCRIFHYVGEDGLSPDARYWMKGTSFEPEYLRPRYLLGRPRLPHLRRLIAENRPKVVFVQEFSMVTFRLAMLRRRYGFRLVSICDDSMDMIEGNDFSRIHRWARKRMPRLVDEILLGSPAVRDWYRNRFGKGIFMPLIHRDEVFRKAVEGALPACAALRRRYGLDDGLPVVLFIGRLVKEKNLECLLEAAAPLRDRMHLVLIGAGDCEAALREADERFGAGALFLGSLYGDDLLPWYHLADILVLPSRQEAFGAVVGEALQVGCPVLVSRRAGAACLVEEGRTGECFDPSSPAECTAALSRMLDRRAPSRGDESLRPNLLNTRFDTCAEQLLRLAE